MTIKRTAALVLGACMALALLTGCAAKAKESGGGVQETPTPTPTGGEENRSITFEDALGHSITVSEHDTVAALMGSFAELWLLAGGALSGVTDDAYSERGLELEESVALLGSYKTPSVEKVIALDPDLVILSADTQEHVALYDTLKAAGVNPAYFSVNLFQDYLDALRLFTSITGREDLYRQNGEEIRADIDAAIARAQGQDVPTVLFIRAFSSGFRAKGRDSMAGAMLYDLGADNIADQDISLLEDLSMEAIIEADPDFIFVVTMGEDHEKALEAVRKGLQDNPAWEGLSAVKAGRYHVLPRELFHYKPNARWAESYGYLADILYGK